MVRGGDRVEDVLLRPVQVLDAKRVRVVALPVGLEEGRELRRGPQLRVDRLEVPRHDLQVGRVREVARVDAGLRVDVCRRYVGRAPREGVRLDDPQAGEVLGEELRADEALAALVQVRLRQEHEPRDGAAVRTLEDGTDRVVILGVAGTLGTGKSVEQLGDVGGGHEGVRLHAADGEGAGLVLDVELLGLGERLGFLSHKRVSRHDTVDYLVAQSRHEMILKVLADAWKVHVDLDSVTFQQLLIAYARELQELGRIEYTACQYNVSGWGERLCLTFDQDLHTDSLDSTGGRLGQQNLLNLGLRENPHVGSLADRCAICRVCVAPGLGFRIDGCRIAVTSN